MRLRRLMVLAFCMLFLLAAAGASAEDWKDEGAVQWKLEDGVLSFRGNGAIPDYEVSSDPPWQTERVDRIVIGDGVTRIGKWAFSFLGYLQTAQIPASVTSVGQGAFQEDDALTDISLPGVTEVAADAFSGCAKMTSVSLPAAETIGANVFGGCGGLRSLELPRLRSAADDAFSGLSDLTVSIPCSRQDETEGFSGTVVLIHSYEKVPGIPATATKDGKTEGSRCSVCKAWEPGHEQKVIPATGVKVTRIKLNKTGAVLYARKGTADTLQLKATVSPSNATNKKLRWTTSNAKVAKVNQNGLVTVVTQKKGTCVITAAARDGSGVKATMKLTVKKNTARLKKLVPAKKSLSLKAGKTQTVAITLSPKTVFNNKLKWTTSDKRVAKVTTSGVIKAVKKGKCVITATATDKSGTKVEIQVTVK